MMQTTSKSAGQSPDFLHSKQIQLEYKLADRPDFTEDDQSPRRTLYATNPITLRALDPWAHLGRVPIPQRCSARVRCSPSDIVCNDVLSWWQDVNPDAELSASFHLTLKA
jgi:hypothetical protein